MQEVNNIFFQKKLVLDTYLIGYKSEGESIVFIINSDDNIVYSGVIDCYEYNGINKTIEILDSKGIKALDFICWTHPDIDHSIGIDKLIQLYTSERTRVILPGHVSRQAYEYNDRVKKTFELMKLNITSRKRRKYRISEVSDFNVPVSKKFLDMSGREYQFTITSIAPNSTFLIEDDFKEGIKNNEYSIALVINFGEFYLLFAGDIENRTINSFEDYYLPKSIDYIKVPHHTSGGSDKLLDYLLDINNICEVGCTTVFRSKKLPKLELMQRYIKYVTDFYCTGKINEEDSSDFGIINIQFDIINKKMYTLLDGNSEKINELNCG